jgi:hypothetical protein
MSRVRNTAVATIKGSDFQVKCTESDLCSVSDPLTSKPLFPIGPNVNKIFYEDSWIKFKMRHIFNNAVLVKGI